MVKLLASALSANDAALTQELLALDVPNTMLVLGAKGRGAGGGGWGHTWGAAQSQPVPSPPGPLLPLRVQQLLACPSGGVHKHDAELRAPCRQRLRHALGEPCRETRELGSWIPIPFGLLGSLLQVSPCLSCAARLFRGRVLVSS